GQGTHSYNSQWHGIQSADFGATTYDWASMPDTLTSSNLAVATLMYHVGVSVNMDYYDNSSGSNLNYAINS
ncbi:MAG: peptidase, partial [Bacteroidetes bacterium CG_4_10_14_3_um_filter_31_20]